MKDFENRLIFGVEVMGKSRLAGGVHSLLQIKPTVHFTCVYVFYLYWNHLSVASRRSPAIQLFQFVD